MAFDLNARVNLTDILCQQKLLLAISVVLGYLTIIFRTNSLICQHLAGKIPNWLLS